MFLPLEGDWMLGKRQQHKQQMSRTGHAHNFIIMICLFCYVSVSGWQLGIEWETQYKDGGERGGGGEGVLKQWIVDSCWHLI